MRNDWEECDSADRLREVGAREGGHAVARGADRSGGDSSGAGDGRSRSPRTTRP